MTSALSENPRNNVHLLEKQRIDICSSPWNSFNVPGLLYLFEWLSSDEELFLTESIDSETWLDDLSRRVQHYGWKYDYKSKQKRVAPPIPVWCNRITNRLQEEGILTCTPDQLIVNEYLPGQGIALHIDKQDLFEDCIVSLSLLSDVAMTFQNGSLRKDILLQRRSLLVMSGNARWDWSHGIAKRKTDKNILHFNGKSENITRQRRISLTFRKMKHATLN